MISSGGLAAGVASAAEPADARPDLRVSVNFTKDVYDNEPPEVVVSVTNVGTAAATSVWGRQVEEPTRLRLNRSTWGPFRGARIEPGQTLTGTLQGYYGDQVSTVLTFTGSVIDTVAGDANEADNHFAVRAIAEGLRGGVSATVLIDNPEQPPLAGVGVEVWSPSLNKNFGRRTTDARGVFSYPDLPAGEYELWLLDGWTVQPGLGRFHVYPNKQNSTFFRGVRTNTNDLAAAVEFQRDGYQPGESAQVAVTLTNRGTTDLAGVRAACTGARDPYALTGAGAGWGELDRYAGRGVTVPAGRSVTVTVSERVPEAARERGYVEVSCGFGNGDDNDDFNHPWASALARVPGMTGGATVTVAWDRNNDGQLAGDGVAGAELVLVDVVSGAETARSVTDATGRAEFRDVPAGRYRLATGGLWRPEYPDDADNTRDVLGGGVRDLGDFLVRPAFVRPGTPDS
ncbi:MSCRAMM family protein [Goodfellowiella coeruleoviolacea]|uniref:SD-repeat containing protein B domain-containing protein n=1 Tax=Goodfellowiella coeruleoviolacea TaxID=334858 RepID=A0AAE3GBM6_9PSEU|nr:hypothetical protein [Goodfellowiella coeruleoviolacea]MCP2164430.1 hypothetical protein [Goodfellowiella coeruleoviolacea]